LKFGREIGDGPFLGKDHKTTPKWAWPWLCDLISKWSNPLITFKRIKLSATDVV